MDVRIMMQKRDCPIEIKILPCGAGWTDISFFIPEEMTEPLILTASDIGRNMSDFARALYYLYPRQFQTGRAGDIVESVDYAYDSNTDSYGKMYSIGEKRPSGQYAEFPIKAEFHWDEEPGGSEWTLTREIPDKPNYGSDFPVDIRIALDRYKGGQFSREHDYRSEYSFKFQYSDLCYAVGKAITEVLKSHGLYGYWYSTSDCIDLVHLVFLKAVALGCMCVCDLSKTGNHYGEATVFKNEVELIMFDM
jgi:hypothetical protein